MTVYVDNVRISWRGRYWCHLVADSIEELHCFARELGLEHNWFQRTASYPHYDVTVEMRDKAVRLGAEFADRRTLISCARRLKAELENERVRRIAQLSLFAD
jgi:hypothetical protein